MDAININSATVQELMVINGIGEAKARSVIEARDKLPGGFDAMSFQLANIAGVSIQFRVRLIDDGVIFFGPHVQADSSDSADLNMVDDYRGGLQNEDPRSMYTTPRASYYGLQHQVRTSPAQGWNNSEETKSLDTNSLLQQLLASQNSLKEELKQEIRDTVVGLERKMDKRDLEVDERMCELSGKVEVYGASRSNSRRSSPTLSCINHLGNEINNLKSRESGDEHMAKTRIERDFLLQNNMTRDWASDGGRNVFQKGNAKLTEETFQGIYNQCPVSVPTITVVKQPVNTLYANRNNQQYISGISPLDGGKATVSTVSSAAVSTSIDQRPEIVKPVSLSLDYHCSSLQGNNNNPDNAKVTNKSKIPADVCFSSDSEFEIERNTTRLSAPVGTSEPANLNTAFSTITRKGVSINNIVSIPNVTSLNEIYNPVSQNNCSLHETVLASAPQVISEPQIISAPQIISQPLNQPPIMASAGTAQALLGGNSYYHAPNLVPALALPPTNIPPPFWFQPPWQQPISSIIPPPVFPLPPVIQNTVVSQASNSSIPTSQQQPNILLSSTQLADAQNQTTNSRRKKKRHSVTRFELSSDESSSVVDSDDEDSDDKQGDHKQSGRLGDGRELNGTGFGDQTFNSVRAIERFKLPTFNGKHWEGFIAVFEETAELHEWSATEKFQHFFRCLKGEAADFYARLSKAKRRNYGKIIKEFSRHFNPAVLPFTARWEAIGSQQREDESLYDYKCRIQELLRKASSNSSEPTDNMGVEIFLRGMKDKEASILVAQKQPRRLNSAYSMAKSAIALREGLGSERKVVRRIADVDSDLDDKQEKFQARFDEMGYLIRNLVVDRKGPRCFNCNSEAHFIRDCPHPRSPRQNYNSGNNGYSPRNFRSENRYDTGNNNRSDNRYQTTPPRRDNQGYRSYPSQDSYRNYNREPAETRSPRNYQNRNFQRPGSPSGFQNRVVKEDLIIHHKVIFKIILRLEVTTGVVGSILRQGVDTRVIAMIIEGLMLRLADIRGVDIRVTTIIEDPMLRLADIRIIHQS